MATAWTKERVLALIGKQLPFLQRHKHVPREGCIWFGAWRMVYHHWARSQSEVLLLLATYISGALEGRITLPPAELKSLLQDVEQGLNAICMAHSTDGRLTFENTNGPWGLGWQSAWWTFRLVRCVHYLRAQLTPETIAAVRRVTSAECDRFIGVRPPSGVKYDTKMEENAWDAPVLAWASFVFADHPNSGKWEFEARRWAFNALTRFKDKFDWRELDGQPIAQWYAGPSLHPDFTSENHGTFHPNYQATVMENGCTALAYLLHDQPVPETLLHNMREVADIFGYCCAPDSTQLMMTGNDWATFHGLHSCLALLATCTADPRLHPLAEANLTKYETLLNQSDNGHIFGSTVDADIDNQRFFFHTCNSTLLTDVYSVLPLEPATPSPVGWEGNRWFEYVEIICQRDATRLASAAWRTLYHTPLFTVIPLYEPTISGCATSTGIGRLAIKGVKELKLRVAQHEEKISPDHWLSTGIIEWCAGETVLARQEISMEATRDRPVLLREKIIAAADLEIETNEGWCMSIANDLHNNYRRRITNEREKTVEVRFGKPVTLTLGHAVRVDDRLIFEADRELHYDSPGQRLRADNNFACTQYDRIIAKAGTGAFASGDIIREGLLRITVLGE